MTQQKGVRGDIAKNNTLPPHDENIGVDKTQIKGISVTKKHAFYDFLVIEIPLL